MSYDKTVSNHYLHGDLTKAIEAALVTIGKSPDTVTIQDLAPVDEFHIGGRLATNNLLNQLDFSDVDRLLDIGCGLGGAARYVATKYNNHVTGIDLTAEYIDTARVLSQWLDLEKVVTFIEGSALLMPFHTLSFDGAYMLHVGMNIKDKELLFAEIYRVLKPGASLGIFDIMRENEGELAYPVPWASDSHTSKLSTVDEYEKYLRAAGFKVRVVNNRRDFSLDFFRKIKQKNVKVAEASVGLHLLMKENTSEKVKNMVKNIKRELISPFEIIAVKE